MSEYFFIYARFEGAGVVPDVPLDATAVGDEPLEGPASDGAVGDAVEDVASECAAFDASLTAGLLEIKSVVGGDFYRRVCDTLGAIARGLARVGAKGGVWVGDEADGGEMLRVASGRVERRSRREAGRLWAGGRRGLEAAAALLAEPSAARKVGSIAPSRGRTPREESPTLAALLAKKRFSRDEEGRLEEELRAAIARGEEASVMGALDHPVAGGKASRALLVGGSRDGLAALARRFDEGWRISGGASLDNIAAVFKLDGVAALDRFRPALDAACAGDPQARMVAGDILHMVVNSWRPESASSWNNLGVPWDVPRLDSRWGEQCRRLMTVPRLGHALWVVARLADTADLQRLLADLPDAALLPVLSALDNPEAARVLRGLAPSRDVKTRKVLLQAAARLEELA